MPIDRDAAAIVGDGDKTADLHLDFDPVGVAGQRLVHGVVDHFGKQVVQRLLVGAADIHARPPAHRLEPFQHFDVLGGVAGFGGAARRRPAIAPAAATAPPNTIVLKEGTEVPLVFASDLSSKTAVDDDPVNLTLAEDLKVGDVVVAHKGAAALGTVSL